MICTPVRVQIGAERSARCRNRRRTFAGACAQGVWNGRGRGRRPAAGHHCGGHDMEAAMDAHCQSVRDRKAGASVTRKQGCSSCAWAFREEQPGGMTALRCGYRAGAAEQTPPRSDGIRMLQPSTCYGRITQLFPTRMDGCADGRPPAWCRGYFIQKEH